MPANKLLVGFHAGTDSNLHSLGSHVQTQGDVFFVRGHREKQKVTVPFLLLYFETGTDQTLLGN